MHTTRLVTIVIGAAFAALALALWIAPGTALTLLGIEASTPSAIATLRPDLAGLFSGLGVLCIAGAFGRIPGSLHAAAVMIAAVALNRCAAVAGGQRSAAQLTMLLVELTAVACLAVLARRRGQSGAPARGRAVRVLTVVGIAVLMILAGAAALLLNPRVQLRLFERLAAQAIAADNSSLLQDDALRVAVCGSSAPLPSRDRAKACVAVFAGGRFYLVDVGPESVENLVLWNIPLARIGGVLLTHFHSDHIGDLGELNLQTWAGGRPEPLRVFGGPGVQRVVDGFNAAYGQDQGYRTGHHGDHVMPAATWPMIAKQVALDGPPSAAKNRRATVLVDGDLHITAIDVDHAPIEPAYAYRFDYKGRSVVVTGDLKMHPPLADAAANADVIVSEAIARSMTEALQHGSAAAGRDRQATIMHDIQDYHISPAEASLIADRAGARLLVLYHLLPAPDVFLTRRLFANDLRRVRGQWDIADDGSLYTMPVGSTEVRSGRVRQ